MAKKTPLSENKNSKNINGDVFFEKAGTIEQKSIINTLTSNYMPYAMSVIISRAIPQIDGFKPSHRKLLYTMYLMGLLTGSRTKSANIVGQTMKLNPHGDSAIYETMVRLTRANESLLHPFIDSKGNFGKSFSRDMAYAASRYTEAKLDSICNELFSDIKSDTVDFVDNYDGTMKEPVLFPTRFPAILVNSNTGIAVSMASNICSFNLEEIIEATKALIKNSDAKITDFIKAPDFSTGGIIIYDSKTMEQILETGRGSFKVRAKYSYDKKANLIDITEIPPTTTIEAIIEKVIELVKGNKIKEISDIRDETGLDGLRITIDLKRGVDGESLMQKLFKLTSLEDSFSCNFNVLIDNSPKVLGVKDLLLEWLKFRQSCVKRRCNFELNEAKDRLHLLLGLKALIVDIDKAIKIIRETKKDDEVVPNLIEGFKIDEIQANFICEIKLRNLNEEYILKRLEEIDNLTAKIKELESILSDTKKINAIISSELTTIAKKYRQDRKSEILESHEVQEYKEEEKIVDFATELILTNDGYFKKLLFSPDNNKNVHKLKHEDEIVLTLNGTNNDEIIFFSDKGNAYKQNAYKFDLNKSQDLGVFIKTAFSLDADEKIIYMLTTKDFAGYLIFVYKNGKIAKVSLSSYKTVSNRKKLINAYSTASELVFISYVKSDVYLNLTIDNDKKYEINTSSIREVKSRSSDGVFGLRIKKGTSVTNCLIVEKNDLEENEIKSMI